MQWPGAQGETDQRAPLPPPSGQDTLLQFRPQISYVGLAFVLIHFAIWAKWNELTLGKRRPRHCWCGSG